MGLTAQKQRFFRRFFTFRALQAKICEKPMKIPDLNKGFLGTTHKVPLCGGFRSLQSLFLQPVGRPQNPDVG